MAQARTTSSSSSEGRISSGTRVRGRVTGEGSLVVEGNLEGEVSIRGDLTIDPGARVVSNVDARTVVVAGTLEGDVNANGAVVIRTGAHVRGDMRGTEVTLDEGAEFAGRLDCEFTFPDELERGPEGSRRK